MAAWLTSLEAVAASRLRRGSPSKKAKNHAHKVAFYTTWCNFVCQHKTLWCSPAIAAGLSSTLWSMANVLALIYAAAEPAKACGPYKPHQESSMMGIGRTIRTSTFLGCALFVPTITAAQRAPMPWETLDHTRPIYLQPWALVCRTIQQAETAGLTEKETGPGCVKPRPGQTVRVTWIGQGAGDYERYQRVRANLGGRTFEGWTLGIDLTNE